MIFEVVKQSHVFFQGLVWKPHKMTLELIENCNLYQATVQTEESFNESKNPEEVFLLQSVEHIIVGQMATPGCNEVLMFAKFIFRGGAQVPVLVKFVENTDFDQFVHKIRLIVREKWMQEPDLFIMNQLSHNEAPQSIKVPNQRYEWVEQLRSQMIEKLSQ